MKKCSFVFAAILFASAPALVWGFDFSGGFPGLWKEGMLAGARSCDPYCGSRMGSFYVGREESGNGFEFAANTKGISLFFGVTDLEHRTPLRGLWLGVSKEISLRRDCGVVVSGWYLIPRGVSELETFNTPIFNRTWDAKAEWGFLEALATFGHGGCSLLAGFRYDHFGTRFVNPFNLFGIESLVTDRTDVTANSYIPLVGIQWRFIGATSSLTVRAVGFPVIPGNLRYIQSFVGALALETTGHYKNSSFLEVFAEYAWKFGPADIGVFWRYNNTHITSDATFNFIVPGGIIAASETFSFGINRNSWTLGGQLDLAF